MNAVKEVALVPTVQSNITAPGQIEDANTLQIFERLARDPAMDVDKLERLMQMHERASARFAQEQFNAAMADAQKAMRPVAADAYNLQTKSRYASYEALDGALRPIYAEHGFGLSFNTGECPIAEMVRVECDVTHRSGHEKRYHIDMPADGKGAKGGDVMTRTHATGAAISYGMRYLLKMMFNVAVGDSDDDGNSATAQSKPAPKAPEGFDRWRDDLVLVAQEGMDALWEVWKQSPKANRDYIMAVFPKAWNDLKATAAKVVKP